ncbi:hypothetical protein HGRIS_008003 [Hohenbuehelia grisea]|uniref:Nucleoporin n=1 Tax=Hohenbuehelia grisea TaxID=104357 RepID=A0ABR3J6N5_9AGAR
MANNQRSFARSTRTPTADAAPFRIPQTKPAAVDLAALQAAAAVLLDQVNKDAQSIPDLGEALITPGPQASASYSVYPNDYRDPFQKKRHVAIPEALFEYYNSANVMSHMGLLPEIGRVWISIDHKLFLWDYIEGQEISSFVDQPDVITHVAIVKPKLGLFIEEISNILVICTPVTVLLIALSFETAPGPNQRPHKDIKLYATDLSLPTDIEMTSIIGTSEGRIFMCGAQDGNLYELHYQEKESWFGKRIQLINHSIGGMQSLLPRFASSSSDDRIISIVADNTRDYFYTLSSKNTISIYKPNGDRTIQHVQTLSNLYKAAQDKAPGSPVLTPQNFTIIGLHVVQPNESRTGIQLMAITANGVRLFFSPGVSYGYSYGPSTSSAPGSRPLQLIHVRLPPSNLLHPDLLGGSTRTQTAYGAAPSQPQASSQPYTISSVEHSCYCDGLTLATQVGDTDSNDFTLCLAPELSRIGTLGQVPSQPQPQQSLYPGSYGAPPASNRPPYTELGLVVAINGRTWGMAAMPHPPSETGNAAPAVINELAYQFNEQPRQFMILTNTGVTFLSKRRVVDYLRAVIEVYQSEGNPQPIMEFRDSFGRDQTCAMLLGLACGNTYLDSGAVAMPGTLAMSSADIAGIAKQAFYDFGERPIWSERATYGTSNAQGTAIFSGRREGLALYFARLVRPIWNSKVTKTGPVGLQQLALLDDTLISIQRNLYSLSDFLSQNPHLFQISPGESVNARSSAGNEQEAWKAEQRSVSQLLDLLTRTIEALSFVLLLNDYRLGDLIALCEADIQKEITSMTYEELITTQNGMNVSRALVNVIIDQQIGQQISVDTISEVLQQRCGSFCSTDDVMLYKARENIRKAVETRNPIERQNWLAESLRLFCKGARNLEFEKLREICGDYQQLNFARGAVELPLTCARLQDPDNIGFDYWLSGSTQTDARAEVYQRRRGCYDLVIDSLQVFEEKNSQAVANASAPSLDDPDAVRVHAYELAFANEDEILHSCLYDWFIERGMADELLDLRPFYLEAYLRRDPATVQKYELLWQFYVKDGQPLRAAEVLATLAESTQFDVNLDTRLQYLTLAVGNAKSHPISAAGRHETAIAFLTDLEEKLEVAQVQLEMYNAVLPYANDEAAGERVKLLSQRLFTMSELYQDYAAAFNLPVLKLVCFHVSEHRDETVVRPVWNQIFEEALEEREEPMEQADALTSKIVPLGQRFLPSESAFPIRHVAMLLVRFSLQHKGVLPHGWSARVLVQCGIPYHEVWDVLHEMYESQVPPFNDQANVQAISSDIAVLLADWLEEAKRPGSALLGAGEFPVGRIDVAIDQYLSELGASRTETRSIYEGVKRQLRRNW